MDQAQQAEKSVIPYNSSPRLFFWTNNKETKRDSRGYAKV